MKEDFGWIEPTWRTLRRIGEVVRCMRGENYRSTGGVREASASSRGTGHRGRAGPAGAATDHLRRRGLDLVVWHGRRRLYRSA